SARWGSNVAGVVDGSPATGVASTLSGCGPDECSGGTMSLSPPEFPFSPGPDAYVTGLRPHIWSRPRVYQVMEMTEPFERAVQQHGATVLRVGRAHVGTSTDADDAWSETFLAALRAWPDLQDETNVEAWLVRVAQRKANDITRARARHAVPVDD